VANQNHHLNHTTSSYSSLFLPPRCLQYGTEFFLGAKLGMAGMMWRALKSNFCHVAFNTVLGSAEVTSHHHDDVLSLAKVI